MKRFAFAAILGLATLMVPSCSKDKDLEKFERLQREKEELPVDPENPTEPIDTATTQVIGVDAGIDLELISKYATAGGVMGAHTFFYSVRLSSRHEIFLPVQENEDEIFYSTTTVIEPKTKEMKVFIYTTTGAEELESVDGKFIISPFEKYEILYVLVIPTVSQTMYDAKVGRLVYQVSVDSELKAKNFPVDMGLRLFSI